MNNYVELKPCTSQKSFYGKARVYREGQAFFLQSYSTIVMCVDTENHTIMRTWGSYSATTQKHVNSFLAFMGINEGGKRFWDSLPVNEEVPYVNA